MSGVARHQLQASLMILWGVPGTGKSTFAHWLVEKKGFMHVDTDAIGTGRAKATALTEAWQGRPTESGVALS